MTELFSLKEALDLYQTQYSQVDKLWSYFGTFTLAVLGFTIGSEKATKSMKEVAVIIIGYLVFCAGNFKALLLGQQQLIDFSHMALKIAEYQTQVFNISSLVPISSLWISLFYWAVVTAVCFGVIFIAWKRQHAKDNQAI